MIKYKIETGSQFLNQKARGCRDSEYKPALRGMRCGKCEEDTVIEFIFKDVVISPSYTMPDVVGVIYHACCSAFENRIKAKVEQYGRDLLKNNEKI